MISALKLEEYKSIYSLGRVYISERHLTCKGVVSITQLVTQLETQANA